MSKLLLFIGENEQFDKDAVVKKISSMAGIKNPKKGNFIGSVFEAEYCTENDSYIIRLSDDLETITVDGIDDNSLNFILLLKDELNDSLQVVDMDYSFHIDLSNVATLSQFKEGMKQGV